LSFYDKTVDRTTLHFERLSPQEQQRAGEEFYLRMRTRRSVREFSEEPVPLELLENAIRCAATAPSGANQQPWRFVVVRDPAIKRRIRLAAEAEERENYQRRFPEEWLQALAGLGTDWHKEFQSPISSRAAKIPRGGQFPAPLKS